MVPDCSCYVAEKSIGSMRSSFGELQIRKLAKTPRGCSDVIPPFRFQLRKSVSTEIGRRLGYPKSTFVVLYSLFNGRIVEPFLLVKVKARLSVRMWRC